MGLRTSYYPNTGPSTSEGHLPMKWPLQDSASEPGLRHKILPPCVLLSPHRSQLACESCFWLLLPPHSCCPTGWCHLSLLPGPSVLQGQYQGHDPSLPSTLPKSNPGPASGWGGWETIVGVPSRAWAWACDPSSSTKLLWTATPQPCQRGRARREARLVSNLTTGFPRLFILKSQSAREASVMERNAEKWEQGWGEAWRPPICPHPPLPSRAARTRLCGLPSTPQHLLGNHGSGAADRGSRDLCLDCPCGGTRTPVSDLAGDGALSPRWEGRRDMEPPKPRGPDAGPVTGCGRGRAVCFGPH